MSESAKTTLVLGDSLLFPSEFLTHVDLKGRAVAVTIEDVKIDNLRARGGKTRKVVIRLVGKEKKFVANKTNCQRIAEVYGGQALKWVGETIVIKPDKDRFGNEMVDCIRVDVAMTKQKAKAKKKPEPAHDPTTGEVTDDLPPMDTDDLPDELRDEPGSDG